MPSLRKPTYNAQPLRRAHGGVVSQAADALRGFITGANYPTGNSF